MKRLSTRLSGIATVIVAAVVYVSLCTSRAFAAPDLSTPKAAAMTFAKALEAGDAATAKASAVGDAQTQDLVGALAEVAAQNAKLREAATAKFGAEASAKISRKMSSEDLSKQLDASEIKEDGDTATITSKETPGNPLTLKKVDGQWKVDMLSGAAGPQLAQQLPMIKSFGGVMSELATEITDGKYKNVDEAQTALQTKMMAAMANMRRPPASQPTTAPSK
jgi:hypothetical protein